MRIADLLPSRAPKNSAYVDWKLRVTRMKKLLENARVFLGALEDGKEKIEGEYIIDERYVFSLVEKAMERTEMMVHDACMLAPEGGGDLFRALDDYWRKARKDFLAPIPRPSGSEEAPLGSEPEVLRLKAFLEWFERGEQGTGSLFSFFKRIVDHLVCSFPQGTFPAQGVMHMGVAGALVENRFRLLDMDRAKPTGPTRLVSVTDIACRPLGLLLMGSPAGDPGAAARERPVLKWFAAMDEDHVSLFSEDPRSPALWLSATLSGHADSDFIFVLGKNGRPAVFPEGFTVETVGDSTFGWIYDVPSHKIEQSLVALGKRCFAV
ncbi:MAG: hypothetical protein AB1921_09290 [Thermodesulfobacteriota bacterium]